MAYPHGFVIDKVANQALIMGLWVPKDLRLVRYSILSYIWNKETKHIPGRKSFHSPYDWHNWLKANNWISYHFVRGSTVARQLRKRA